jgi:hypothetical protein
MVNNSSLVNTLSLCWGGLALIITILQILTIIKANLEVKNITKSKDIVAGSVNYWKNELDKQRESLRNDNFSRSIKMSMGSKKNS